MKQLKLFLSNPTLFKTALPNAERMVEFLLEHKEKNTPLQLFYGETFDEYGMTIDSLKYYFVLSLFHHYLEQQGIEVRSVIIQADLASLLNKSVAGKQTALKKQSGERLALLKKIKEVYHLPIEIELMSDLFQTDEYKKNIELVNKFAKSQDEKSLFFQLLAKTVLQNRVSQEKVTQFQYAREAIATSMLFDVKLGPPRETFYDLAQNILAEGMGVQNLLGLYLQPSYPLSKDFAYFLTHKEIEEYGVTPYKAGSNKLQDHRIILEKTSHAEVEMLVQNSFESPNHTAHPVLDMFVIGDLAQRFFTKNFALPNYNQDKLLQNLPHLRQEATTLISTCILDHFPYATT